MCWLQYIRSLFELFQVLHKIQVSADTQPPQLRRLLVPAYGFFLRVVPTSPPMVTVITLGSDNIFVGSRPRREIERLPERVRPSLAAFLALRHRR